MNKNLKRGHTPGETHPNARLSDEMVTLIRTRTAAGEKQVNLAREYGVSPGTVSKIVTGKLRPHIPLHPRPKRKGEGHPRAKLTKEQATRIWERLQAGEGVRPLAREHNVSPSVVHRIKTGRAWKDVKPAQRRRKVWEK